MLRVYFKYDRKLLTQLCHCAKESLELFLGTVLGLDDGIPGMIMVIHTSVTTPGFIHTSMPLSPTASSDPMAPSIACPKACPEPVEGRVQGTGRDIPCQSSYHAEK